MIAQEVRPGPVALPFALHVIASARQRALRSAGELQVAGAARAEGTLRGGRRLLGDVPLEVRAGARCRDQGGRRPASKQRVVTRGRGLGEGAFAFEAGASTAAAAAIDTTTSRIRFFISFIRCGLVFKPDGARNWSGPVSDHLLVIGHTTPTQQRRQSQNYTTRSTRDSGSICS